MCIAAWIWQSHPSYQLLLLLNRDEFHERPTREVEWWEEKKVLAGRDELGGGTWLGCNKEGKLAFLTNFREPNNRRSDAKSRGNLPIKFLQSELSPMECAEEIAREADSYNGFNLVLADIHSKSMAYVSNRPKGNIVIKAVSPGLHVLSNASLDTPWSKSERLRSKFEEYINAQVDKEIDSKKMVENLMEDNTKADRSVLPITGCDPELEFELSSIFIDNYETKLGRYGTRSMSCIAIKTDNEVSFYERYLESSVWKEHITEFHIEKS
ncbi:hypothetical protein LUZ60_016713 [Juncus effusus]|nr:hypothetical protein LUZ60_016713 [Juncus effusus]